MSKREAYIRIKRRDLQALKEAADKKSEQGTREAEKLRTACQSASVMLDRVERSNDDNWQEMQLTVDSAFRHAFDCMQKVEAHQA